MVLFRIAIGSIWVSILLIGHAIQTPREMPAPRLSISSDPDTLWDASADEQQPWAASGLSPRLDVHGNPIERAVGDYRTDFRGDTYERHAPDTAVLELAPPGV
jgi:hypothetical protein